MQNEQVLLARARALDEAALAEIHDKFYTPIFRYIALRVGDRELAEDLTSDVFLRLLNALRDNTAPQKTLQGWLYAVASRVVIDHLRRKYRRREVELDEFVPSSGDDPAEIVETQLTWETLQEAIQELTTEQQEVIALRFGQGLPIQEVAQTIDKTEGAVKQLQSRAVAALSRRLSGLSKKKSKLF